MSMDLTAKNMKEIIEKALDNHYNDVGGCIVDIPYEKDGSIAPMTKDQLMRKGFKENFVFDEFVESLKDDADFIDAVYELLEDNF